MGRLKPSKRIPNAIVKTRTDQAQGKTSGGKSASKVSMNTSIPSSVIPDTASSGGKSASKVSMNTSIPSCAIPDSESEFHSDLELKSRSDSSKKSEVTLPGDAVNSLDGKGTDDGAGGKEEVVKSQDQGEDSSKKNEVIIISDSDSTVNSLDDKGIDEEDEEEEEVVESHDQGEDLIDEHEVIKGTGTKGLRNKSHYCFGNAALQFIYRTDFFRDLFNAMPKESDEVLFEMDNDGKYTEAASVAQLFEEFRHTMLQMDKNKSIQEIDKRILDLFANEYGGDSNEILEKLFYYIHAKVESFEFIDQRDPVTPKFYFSLDDSFEGEYEHDYVLFVAPTNDLVNGVKILPAYKQIAGKTYKIDTGILATEGHFVMFKVGEDEDMFIANDKDAFKKIDFRFKPFINHRFDIDSYLIDKVRRFVYHLVYYKRVDEEFYPDPYTTLSDSDKTMFDDLCYIVDEKGLSGRVIDVLTVQQLDLIKNHSEVFTGFSKDRINSRMRYLTESEAGRTYFIEQINNPAKSSTRIQYDALMRQRQVQLKHIIENTSQKLIKEQIDRGLLSEATFPFIRMQLTDDLRFLVEWDKLLCDPVVALGLTDEALKSIAGAEDLSPLMCRAIALYAYDKVHNTKIFDTSMEDIIKQYPAVPGERRSIHEIKKEVQIWIRKNKVHEHGGGVQAAHKVQTTQYVPEVNVKYFILNEGQLNRLSSEPEVIATCLYFVDGLDGKPIEKRSMLITEPLTTEEGEKQIREDMLDFSIYVNEATKVNITRKGQKKFEEAIYPTFQVAYNYNNYPDSYSCVIKYGTTHQHQFTFKKDCQDHFQKFFEQMEEEARKAFKIPKEFPVILTEDFLIDTARKSPYGF